MTTKPAVNSTVIIRPELDADMTYAGIPFTVVEHRRTNIVVEAQGPAANMLPPKRRRLLVKPEHVTAAPADMPEGTATSVMVDYHPPITLGAVFTVPAGVLRGVTPNTLLVVIGTNGEAYKAARLGGDGDRYFPKVARAAMTEVPAAELAARLTN